MSKESLLKIAEHIFNLHGTWGSSLNDFETLKTTFIYNI